METTRPTLCIVGLGYVGLPLANLFARNGYRVLGYDIAQKRIDELNAGTDRTHELTPDQLLQGPMTYSSDPAVIGEADIIIVTVPTPVDERNLPDLSPVESASITVGKHLKKGAIVVYESTVYPGVTEELCGPILARESGLVCGQDFTLGYSPERINPGDKEHTVDKIMKVVGGQDEQTTDRLVKLYGSVVTAGIHRTPDIKTAEMAKAIENAQRDLNIAYVNEVAVFCNALGIGTKAVLEAAGTKWNFLKFQPGLVGGHCIGVDPYYLVEKGKMLGIDTHVITAGRGRNDSMGPYVAKRVINHLKVPPPQSRVLILGVTFKENIPDTRNSKVTDVAKTLKAAECQVFAHDPQVSAEELERLGYVTANLQDGPFDAVLYLVPHKEYRAMKTEEVLSLVTKDGVLYDLKSLLDGDACRKSGRTYFTL